MPLALPRLFCFGVATSPVLFFPFPFSFFPPEALESPAAVPVVVSVCLPVYLGLSSLSLCVPLAVVPSGSGLKYVPIVRLLHSHISLSAFRCWCRLASVSGCDSSSCTLRCLLMFSATLLFPAMSSVVCALLRFFAFAPLTLNSSIASWSPTPGVLFISIHAHPTHTAHIPQFTTSVCVLNSRSLYVCFGNALLISSFSVLLNRVPIGSNVYTSRVVESTSMTLQWTFLCRMYICLSPSSLAFLTLTSCPLYPSATLHIDSARVVLSFSIGSIISGWVRSLVYRAALIWSSHKYSLGSLPNPSRVTPSVSPGFSLLPILLLPPPTC